VWVVDGFAGWWTCRVDVGHPASACDKVTLYLSDSSDTSLPNSEHDSASDKDDITIMQRNKCCCWSKTSLSSDIYQSNQDCMDFLCTKQSIALSGTGDRAVVTLLT
jgi:hypothetical protein